VSKSFLEGLGLARVINAVGPATRLGSSVLAPDVIAAMTEVAGSFVRMNELQDAAGAVIAQITGAEAGYVTNGAAGGLMLAAAACIAGQDPLRMNQLPDATGMPSEIIIHRIHRNGYDHALRAAGATLVEIGFPDLVFPYELTGAINERTAAVAYHASIEANALPLAHVIEVAHQHGVPVIVDASLSVPPPSNLRKFVDLGADLVVISGGKWINGPAASGFIAGRADLIRSIAYQHQDADVRVETWHDADRIEAGEILGPPHQGIGRALKVGKEEVAGLISALRAYVDREHDADQRRWTSAAQRVIDAVRDVPGVTARLLPPDGRAHGWPIAEIDIDSSTTGTTAYEVITSLAAMTPSIALDEAVAWRGAVRVTPTHLLDDDDRVIARALVAALSGGAEPTKSQSNGVNE
jgi:L-seryl-tRNA(Ser) seleniumtransferase